MRLWFVIHILIFTMSLKNALSFIIKQKSNHASALIELLKNSVKEAKTQERIIFLIECKKANLICCCCYGFLEEEDAFECWRTLYQCV